MKSRILILCLCLFGLSAAAQEKIEWLTIEQAQEQAAKDKNTTKKYLVDCYTDWCGWCKRMDSDTFSDTLIARIVNHYFYPVKFNAEQREDVTLAGKVYKNTGKAGSGRRGSPHQLAYYLLNNRLSYPSFSILGADCKVILAQAGYFPPKDFEPFLVYIGEELYKELDYKVFSENYESKYRADILKKLYDEKK